MAYHLYCEGSISTPASSKMSLKKIAEKVTNDTYHHISIKADKVSDVRYEFSFDVAGIENEQVVKLIQAFIKEIKNYDKRNLTSLNYNASWLE